MDTTWFYRILIVWSLLFTGTAFNGFCQSTKKVSGKYCEDLGFGGYCIDFKQDGTYRLVSGHSYSRYKMKGTWYYRNDTIVTVSVKTKKMEVDTSFYYMAFDSLYAIYYDHQIRLMTRSKPLQKQ